MAKAKGMVTIEGTIGDLTFVETQDGLIARKKGGVSADRIENDPAFEGLRQHGKEFGRAGRTSTLIRKAFRECLQNSKDGRMTSRLTTALLRIIKADPNNDKGERVITNAALPTLEGFEFNANTRLSSVFFPTYTIDIDRPAGEARINIQPYIPKNSIEAPPGATHFRIEAGSAEINFTEFTGVPSIKTTPEIKWDLETTEETEIILKFTPNSIQPILLCLGVEFFELVNQKYYPKAAASNPLAIIKIAI